MRFVYPVFDRKKNEFRNRIGHGSARFCFRTGNAKQPGIRLSFPLSKKNLSRRKCKKRQGFIDGNERFKVFWLQTPAALLAAWILTDQDFRANKIITSVEDDD